VVRIKCAVCPDFDLCLLCFSAGVEARARRRRRSLARAGRRRSPLCRRRPPPCARSLQGARRAASRLWAHRRPPSKTKSNTTKNNRRAAQAQVTPHRAHHAFRVIDFLSFPVYEPDWGADEESLLLEALDVYGPGACGLAAFRPPRPPLSASSPPFRAMAPLCCPV